MRPVTVQVGPFLAANASLFYSGTPGGAGNLALSTLVPDTARRVLLTTTSASDSGKTLTVVGTDANGSLVTEIITAPAAAGTALSALDYASLKTITASAAFVGSITIGTSTTISSGWVRLDDWSLMPTALQITVNNGTGAINYTLQQTLQDPHSPTNPIAPYLVTWLNSQDTNVVNASTTVQSNYAYAPSFAKVTVNSYSGTASLTATFSQGGNVPL
jgi:hypothetical protein